MKCNIMHDIPLENLVETLKEELDNFKFFMQAQPVQSISVDTIEWFMYLYLDLHLRNFEALLRTSVTYLLKEEPIFTLTRKTIFDGISNDISTTTKTSRSFTKKTI